jgi:hypothetical protein
VKFVGYYDAFQIDNTDTDIYYMTAGNVLDFYTGTDPRTLYPFRAYFQFTGFSSAPEFSLDFGDDTTVISRPQLTTEDGEWYTLQGLKIGKKPTTAGVYIHNGKKFVIK